MESDMKIDGIPGKMDSEKIEGNCFVVEIPKFEIEGKRKKGALICSIYYLI